MLDCGELDRLCVNNEDAFVLPREQNDLIIGEDAPPLIHWVSMSKDACTAAPAAQCPSINGEQSTNILITMHFHLLTVNICSTKGSKIFADTMSEICLLMAV